MGRLQVFIRMLLRRGREGRRLNEELAFHVEEQTRENLLAGMRPEEARAAALRGFGNPLLLREQARAHWGWAWLEALGRDGRQGARRLGRAPGFALSVVLILGLGVGAVAALFTVVHAVLLRPLPFPAQERLVRVYEAVLKNPLDRREVAGGTYQLWRKGSRSFEQLAIKFNGELDANLTGMGGQLPERVHVAVTAWDLLPTLGVQPVLGRFFSREDDRTGAPATVVLTWTFWQRRFGGSPAVLGSTLTLDAKPHTIIGVLPRWFRYPDAKTQLWTPLRPLIPAQFSVIFDSHDSHNFMVLGRLKPGVSMEQAQTELSGIANSYAQQHIEPYVNNQAHMVPLLQDQVADVRTGLYALLAATGCLLLIACLNIANLFLARSAALRREAAIRAALGGGFLQRLRAQMTESLLLALAGSALGIGLAYGAVAWVRHARSDLPRAEDIHVDALALLVAIGAACMCAALAGLLPVLATSDRSLLGALREGGRAQAGGRGGLRLRKMLIGAEVAATVVLLVGSGLLLKSYQHLRSRDFGCDPRNALTLGISLPEARYATPASRTQFFEALLLRIRALPGVRSAGLSSTLPGQGHQEDDGYTVHEDPPLPKGQGLSADVRWVDPDYFGALRAPLIRGRVFLPEERGERRRVCLISQSLAKTIFAGRDPLGKHLDDANNDPDGKPASNEIVGVVGDLRPSSTDEPQPNIYFPMYGGVRSDASLIIRTAADPLAWSLPVQKVLADLDPTLAAADVLPFRDVLLSSAADTGFEATLLTAFAAISLALASAGLFGVLSYVVAMRRSELGIRLALGAQRGQILSLVLGEGLRPALAGIAAGLLLSAGVARLIGSLLHGAQPLDFLVDLGVCALLLLAAALACALPAWAASRLEPAEALRIE